MVTRESADMSASGHYAGGGRAHRCRASAGAGSAGDGGRKVVGMSEILTDWSPAEACGCSSDTHSGTRREGTSMISCGLASTSLAFFALCLFSRSKLALRHCCVQNSASAREGMNNLLGLPQFSLRHLRRRGCGLSACSRKSIASPAHAASAQAVR